ncbi:MAG: hypothetical protein C5B59_16375 [Bacteroidetes bacterium]|nr:MAG: hypothetical protein C5B59_16375 [Bacteroidota bacterium]
MRLKRLLSAIAFLFLLQNYLLGQDKPNIKFGKISLEDFNLSKQIDSNDDAIVITDIGSAQYMSDYIDPIKLVYTRHRRMKILSKRGVMEAANVSLPIYLNGMKGQRITSFKAATYNLENGRVVETKVDEKNVYDDRIINNFHAKKFAFPDVREGSIVEFSVVIESPPILNLPSWEFQGIYPCLWSEYSVSIPEYFNFDFFPQGSLSFFVNEKGRDNFNMGKFMSIAITHHWVMKDVPAIKMEPYSTTYKNHISKIEFQLTELRLPEQKTYNILGNWPQICHDLMESDNFGAELKRNNGWLDEDLKIAVQNQRNKLEEAKSVYIYVRDHFSRKDGANIGLTKSLKTVLKDKAGNEAEINLLLVAMLNHIGINSSPVILSTRNNGYINPVFPILSKFNYTVCEAEIDSNEYYLDASNTNLDFNQLPAKCYNGIAMVIENESPREVAFLPDSLQEKKITSVFIINDSTGMPTGSYQSVLGKNESFELRESLKKETEEEYFQKLNSEFGTDLGMENPGIDSISKPEFPISVHFDFNLKLEKNSNILYFNPMQMEAMKENPFKSAIRTYPVEMPHTIDEVYSCTMEIPAGYSVEELPKSERIEFNEGNGYFEYIVSKSDTEIQFRSRVKLGKAIFMPEDYNTLREFYGAIVKKQSEQIVFRKNK